MGALDSTASMSGVAMPAQPQPQPPARTSGRKRKTVSYAEDQPNDVVEQPVKKRLAKAVAGEATCPPTKQAKGKPKNKATTTIEKRLKRQVSDAKYCTHDVVELTIRSFRDKPPQTFFAVQERALTQR